MQEETKMTNIFEPKTYFCCQSLPLNSRPTSGILVYPSSDKWNDFGHRTLFVFEVLDDPTPFPRTFRLGFLAKEDEQPATIIQNCMLKQEENYLTPDDLPPFFSLQFSMKEYRSLVLAYGVQKAEAILLSLHDMVATRTKLPVPQWVEEATKSEIFTHSLIRTSDAFFAYYNARSILAGLNGEDLHKVSSSFKLKFQLTGFTNSHEFNFKFDTRSLVPKRIAVLVGKNGVGKSRTLNQLIHAALEGDEGLADDKGGRPMISRIIAVCTPGETDATFPQVPKKIDRVNYLRLSALPGERADTTGGQTLPEVILQLARKWDAIGDQHRWDIFHTAVSRIIPFDSLRIIPPLRPLTTSVTPSVMAAMGAVDISDLRNGGEQRCLDAARRLDFSGQVVRQIGLHAVPLSSGQLSFLRLAAQLSLHIENGSLLLIDEPETHLHPNLITDLVAMLNKILELSGSIAIVATHSAYLVREVPSSQVHVIREIPDRLIEILTPRLKTFGADVGAISNFIFGDEIVNRLVEEVEQKVRESPEVYKNWREQLRSELSTEAEMYLAQEISGPGEPIE
jgi:predicted ATPase